MVRHTAAPAWVEFADTLPQCEASFHASGTPAASSLGRASAAGEGVFRVACGTNGYIQPVICKKCLVSGRVQGVFYRGAAAQRARELGVHGYARNLPDGRVEVLACGDDEAVETFVGWLWIGSSAAKVSGVEVADAPEHGAPADFHIA